MINKIVSKINEFFECMLKCEVNNLVYVLFNENYVSLYMWYVVLYIEEYSIRWLLFMYVLLLFIGGFWRE